MTNDTQRQGANGRDGIPPADAFVLSLAGDGSVLVIMPGSDLDASAPILVEVERGVLSVSQREGNAVRVAVRGPVDDEGRAFLAPLPAVEIVEVYPGPTEDESRFERFPAENVTLRYEGRGGNG